MTFTTMKTKGNKQNKLLRRMAGPFRALNRFYTKTLFGCAANFDHASTVVNYGMGPQVSASLPRNFSTNSSASSRESIDREEEELRELIRAVSTKLYGSTKVEQNKKVELRKPTSVVAAAVEMRSYSVGVGKIGRIDEDQPCDFKELGDADLRVYPRSRSYAVTRRTIVF